MFRGRTADVLDAVSESAGGGLDVLLSVVDYTHDDEDRSDG